MDTLTLSPELRDWHKSVAVECNNRAWELSVRSRSAAEDREMLTAAHASAYHWTLIGTEQNRMRAIMLLAEVHALLGHGNTALSLAEEMRAYFLGRSDTPDWELAFVHGIHAHAAYTAGNLALHRASYQQAQTAFALVADKEDRAIIANTFAHIPVPVG